MSEPLQRAWETDEGSIALTRAGTAPEHASGREGVPSHPDPIDKGVFECLCTLQRKSSSNVLGKVLRIYLTDSAHLVASLRECVGSGDTQGARNAAHSLTSSSTAIGAMTLAALCRVLESSCRGHSQEDEGETMRMIEDEYGRVQKTLREELQRRRL